MSREVVCDDDNCLFHKGKTSCYLSPEKNLYVLDKYNCVRSCIHRIYRKSDLSQEGNAKLDKLKKGETT